MRRTFNLGLSLFGIVAMTLMMAHVALAQAGSGDRPADVGLDVPFRGIDLGRSASCFVHFVAILIRACSRMTGVGSSLK